jgi:transposase
MARDTYRTDLTDAEWKILEPHLPPPAPSCGASGRRDIMLGVEQVSQGQGKQYARGRNWQTK